MPVLSPWIKKCEKKEKDTKSPIDNALQNRYTITAVKLAIQGFYALIDKREEC